jgi:hypothetical protein
MTVLASAVVRSADLYKIRGRNEAKPRDRPKIHLCIFVCIRGSPFFAEGNTYWAVRPKKELQPQIQANMTVRRNLAYV